MAEQELPAQDRLQSVGQSAVPDPMSPQPQQDHAPGLAVAGMVIGIVALLMSFIPIVNNAAFFLAVVGIVLSAIGRSKARKKARPGGGLAMAGLVLGIVAIVVTLMVQAACSAALDSIASSGSGTVASEAVSDEASEQGDSKKIEAGDTSGDAADTANMKIGQTVDLHNGLSITVKSVKTGLTDYSGSKIVGVKITYKNNGDSNSSFNELDWKAEDEEGAQRSSAFYAGDDDLGSGTLSPGGSATGMVYFEAPIVKLYYYSSFLTSDSDIAWNVE